jgi:uncharacterized protein YuzE
MAKSDIVTLRPEAVDVEYDKKADVLYISFNSDTIANDSELTNNNVVIRYKKTKIIGLTVLHFSERHKQKGKPTSKS